MGGDFFGNLRPASGVIERPLDIGFVEMIAPPLPGFHHHRQRFQRKEPLVDKFLWGVWIFFLLSVRGSRNSGFVEMIYILGKNVIWRVPGNQLPATTYRTVIEDVSIPIVALFLPE